MNQVSEELETQLELAFAPVDKRSMGVAVGATLAVLIWLVTVAGVVLDPEGRVPLVLLSEYFAGYGVSWGGAFIGAAWGLFVGFVVGWFLAFARNLTLAVWIFVVRARAEYRATRDFLDHI